MISVPLIDRKKCTLCGECVTICPKKVLTIRDRQVRVTVEECMLCSHCYSVCRYSAIRFDPEVLFDPAFTSFPYKERYIAPGRFKASDLVNLFRSRRSVRRFRPDQVSNDSIDDLISFAVTAPSGSNCQTWEFLSINGRDKVWDLALEIRKFFVRLNRMAKNPIIRYLSILVTGKTLIRYYNDHMESVEMALKEAEAGKDLLFHDAPALIILHGPMDGSTPVEDAQYASYNMTLLAHALGLGTCYIGYAVESINRAPFLKQYLGIPPENSVHAVLALGHPDAAFTRPALRKRFPRRSI
jgi:nitroreductase/NAD-dependent dihydropyrimidine dehydrogenase PreA subunit